MSPTPPAAPTEEVSALCRRAAERARAARLVLASMTGGERSAMLRDVADSIEARGDAILAANADDLDAGSDLSPALRDRLTLDRSRVEKIASAVRAIADQPDPIGRVVDGRVLPNGIRLEKRRVPIGVVLVIYESRPNVTADAAALCLKAGNAVVLRGGKESIRSNRAIAEAVHAPLAERGAADAAPFIDVPDRSAIGCLVKMSGLIDLCIPRGGAGLIRAVTEAAIIPVVKHDAGVCHVYIDEHLDAPTERMALDIALNAKVQRPGVCNAMETLLVHEDAAPRVLPAIGERLRDAGVELRGCPRTRELLPFASAASPDDWPAEYLDLILAVRVVASLDDAAEHIRTHGSAHTDAIVTASLHAAQRFRTLVDSANVMINCSTRFADGGEYGLGAEIGISTDKLHARGPMGAEDLTTYQWVAEGTGQTRR